MARAARLCGASLNCSNCTVLHDATATMTMVEAGCCSYGQRAFVHCQWRRWQWRDNCVAVYAFTVICPLHPQSDLAKLNNSIIKIYLRSISNWCKITFRLTQLRSYFLKSTVESAPIKKIYELMLTFCLSKFPNAIICIKCELTCYRSKILKWSTWVHMHVSFWGMNWGSGTATSTAFA